MVDFYKRKCKFADLKPYCIFAKDSDFIEVCEWYNGEGLDIEIGNSNGGKKVSLTWGELEAVIALSKLEGG